MLKHIVKGNTLYITWNIAKNASLTIENYEVKLYDGFHKSQDIEYTVDVEDENIEITITYQGTNQRTIGTYSLAFYNNFEQDSQNLLIYKEAFVLVRSISNKLSSYNKSYIDEDTTIELDSDITVNLFDTSVVNTYINRIDELSNDVSTIIDTQIAGLQQEILDNERVIVEYLKIIDSSVNSLM